MKHLLILLTLIILLTGCAEVNIENAKIRIPDNCDNITIEYNGNKQTYHFNDCNEIEVILNERNDGDKTPKKIGYNIPNQTTIH